MANTNNINDKVYTPHHVADEVHRVFSHLIKPEDTMLEPFDGEGSFSRLNWCENQSWCEIDKGRDFLQYDDHVDWIVTNPPYSTFDQMLNKMMDVSTNMILVIPVNKLLSSMKKLLAMKHRGFYIHHIHYLGSGRSIGFPFGFPVGAMLIKSEETDCMKITYMQ